MSKLTAWERIEIIRNKNRPTLRDYLPLLFGPFYELHGDRYFGDDEAVLGGVTSFQGRPVTVVGMVKGKTLEEKKRCNFAMPNPEGYRKAMRLMKQAEKFRRPVFCFVDTPAANPGVGAEERGQGEAIARCLMECMRLKTPVITVITGEGGSGGALALSVCDELAMLENAVFSVISPRGFASILWKDGSREKEAAELLKMTAQDVKRLGVADHIIPEPRGGAHTSPELTAAAISAYLSLALARVGELSEEELLRGRYEKYRRIAFFSEDSPKAY